MHFMDFDRLSRLPEWDDDDFRDEDEEGERWKPNPTRDACKALYLQWQQVMILLNGALDSMDVEEKGDASLHAAGKAFGDAGPERQGFPADYWEDHKAMILGMRTRWQ